MALNIETFKQNLVESLKAAAEQNASEVTTMEAAMNRLAEAIAGPVDEYIKTMTITIPTGVVQVQGTAAAQSNVAPIVIDNGIT